MTGSQTLRVKDWLQTGHTITSKEAFDRWGITRLSAIILNLRHQGYSIMTTSEEAYNRYGEKVRYGRYSLCPDNDLEEVSV